MGNAVRGRLRVEGGGIGSHRAEKDKPSCPKSFQQLILLCCLLHYQTQPFLIAQSPRDSVRRRRRRISGFQGYFILSRCCHHQGCLPLPPPCLSSHPWQQPEELWGCSAHCSSARKPLALGALCGCLREQHFPSFHWEPSARSSPGGWAVLPEQEFPARSPRSLWDRTFPIPRL